MKWLETSINNYKELLNDGMDIYNSKEKAKKYADENSTAGTLAKKEALKMWN